MSAQLNIAFDSPRRLGAQRALDHAGDAWRTSAYTYLCQYARTHDVFSGEDVSDAHIAAGLPQPQDLRSWGNLYRLAVKERVIQRLDNDGHSKRRASPCPRYRSLACRVAA